jgi:hypothetical protein
LEDHVGEKGWSLNWPTKLRPAKKTPSTSFPNCLVKNAWIKSPFPYGLSPHHEEAKQNAIGVVRGTSAKLPHYMGPTLVYLIENEMPLVHHVVERWGCGYIDKDNKDLNERTQRHLMLKPKSKLMQMEWE